MHNHPVPDHAKPSALLNLGPKSDTYLAEIGVRTVGELRAMGPVEAFLRMSRLSKHLRNRMALYALYGALSDQNCIHLPEETKQWLEEQLDAAGYDG